jgi:hypothetical protein
MVTNLTPAQLRQDLKCGNGSISKGEKCRKGNSGSLARGQENPISIRRGAATGLKYGAIAGTVIGGLAGAATGHMVGGGKLGSTLGWGAAGALDGALGSGIKGAAIGAGVNAVRKATWRPSEKKRRDSVWADGFAPN